MTCRAFAVLVVLAIIVIVVTARRKDWRFRDKFGCPACKTDPRLNFNPVPELVCGLEPVPEYAVDVTGRSPVGTVVWEPFASSRSEHIEARSEHATARKHGRLQDNYDTGGGASSVLAGTVGRSPSNVKSRNSSCPGALSHLDSDVNSELISDPQVFCDNDGVNFKDMPDSRAGRALIIGEKMAEERVKLATKYPQYYNRNIIRDPANLRMGLGSTYRDPLFQPGPQKRIPTAGAYAGNGYGPAQGTHAGGDTLGALVPATFLPSAQWDTEYVKGFGGQWGPDYSLRAPPVEVLRTSMSGF